MEEKHWIEIEINDDKTVGHRIGPVGIWLKKIANEVWIAHTYSDPDDGKSKKGRKKVKTTPDESELNWSRWALKGDNNRFRLIPVFPDRPVIIKPEYPFQIVPGADAKVYTRIPVFIRIVPSGQSDLVITEIPTVVMSGTWFGLFTEGEICYWVSTTARRVLEPEMFLPWLVVCPLRIANNADYNLNFDKLCLRVDRMTMYQANEVLWADETLISYRGGNNLSDVEMKGKLPPEAKDGKMISRPRTPIKKSLAVRSFKMFMERVGM